MILAKARCAKTVICLMKDRRSVEAVNVAEKFGLGQATLEELKIADAAAYAADAAARLKNQKQTARVCRKILGAMIVEEVVKRLN